MRSARPAGSRLLGGAAVVLLVVLSVLALRGLAPPEPAAADAPAGEFSAGRAFAEVEQVAAAPHVTGSAANDEVREHLLAVLDGLGLQPRVQDAVGVNPGAPGVVEYARVRNVVGVLPGTDPTGRLFLVAHHDSVETGPGGNDDAAGVAAVLETVRALGAGPRLRNDVVVVLTDAEEACLCGAEAFAGSDPLAEAGGVVLNLEARGTGGPPIMFETSLGNAALAGVFAGSAPHPVATSFAVEVYRLLPNDTDFSTFRDAGGFTGLNTAYIDGSAAYHTPQDTPDRMDRGSLQAMGDNTLALTRALGQADLGALARPAGGDATYFPVLGGLVRYPGALVWPVAVLAVVAVGGLALVAARRGTSLRRTAAGVLVALVPVVLAPVAAQAAWTVLTLLRPGYAGMTDPWRPGAHRLAVVALVLAVVLAWYGLARRRFGAVPLAVGGLTWLAVIGVVLAAVAPGGSYLTAVPALGGAVAGLAAESVRSAWVRLVAGVLAGAVAVLVLVPTISLFFPALGLATAAAPALFTGLLALALLPVLEWLFPEPGSGGATGRHRRWGSAAVPLTAAALALALFAVGLGRDGFDARHPLPTQLMYALDADEGRAWWLSTEHAPGEWTSRYVGDPAEPPAEVADSFPVFAGEVATGPAEVADLPAPELQTAVADDGAGRRTVTVSVRSLRAARLLVLDVAAPDGAVVGGEVAGRSVPGEVLGTDRLTVTFHAPPGEGVTATLTVDGGGPVTVRALDGTDGLAELPGFRPRPPEVGVAGTHTSDLLLVETSRTL